MPAPAVPLQREVELLRPHAPPEVLLLAWLRLPLAHPGQRRHDLHPVHGPRPAEEEVAVPGGAEEDDLGLGVGGGERAERREGEHEVPERVGAQHGDLPDALDAGALAQAGHGRHGAA